MAGNPGDQGDDQNADQKRAAEVDAHEHADDDEPHYCQPQRRRFQAGPAINPHASLSGSAGVFYKILYSESDSGTTRDQVSEILSQAM